MEGVGGEGKGRGESGRLSKKDAVKNLMAKASPLITERSSRQSTSRSERAGGGGGGDGGFYNQGGEEEEEGGGEGFEMEGGEQDNDFLLGAEGDEEGEDSPFPGFKQQERQSQQTQQFTQNNPSDALFPSPHVLTRAHSAQFLKKKLMTEDRLLQTVNLPPHHLRKQQSKSTPKLSSTPYGHRKTTAEEILELEQKRTTLELHMENAIREIFSEIKQRKQSSGQLSSTRLPSMNSAKKLSLNSPALSPSPLHHENSSPTDLRRSKSGSIRLNEPDHHIRVDPVVKSHGGITGLGLEQFTDNDRFAAIVKVLANPEVFRMVKSSSSPTPSPLNSIFPFLGCRQTL